MANEIRLRVNNEAGSITDNPLTIGATTINSANFANLPVVDATNHLMLILDPLEASGPAEIVKVTAHTAAATSVTVLRGQEGSAARSHILNTTWYHGPTRSDFIESDYTSGTRPTDPYEGRFIYERDTNKLMGWGGVDWAPRDAGGQLGYAQVTAIQGGIVATTAITGLSVNVTVGTNRRIKITGQVLFDSSGSGDEIGALSIRQDGVQVLVAKAVSRLNTSQATIYSSYIVTPTAGSRTYDLTLNRDQGAGTLRVVGTAISPCYILVEDIGAA